MSIISGIVKNAKMIAIGLAMGMKRMEDKSITQLGVDDNNDMIRQHEQNSLTNDLMNGRSNTRVKVYAERFFQIMENADKFANRNKMSFNGNIEDGEISLESTQINESDYYTSREKMLNNIVDTKDNYKLETIIDMKRICNNDREVAMEGKTPTYDCNLRLFSGEDEIILMENTLQSIHIKTIPNSDDLRLLDLFFTFDSNEIEYMNEVIKDSTSFIKFDSISINKGKYKPKIEMYDVVKLFDVSNPTRSKLCYKVICKKVI